MSKIIKKETEPQEEFDNKFEGDKDNNKSSTSLLVDESDTETVTDTTSEDDSDSNLEPTSDAELPPVDISDKSIKAKLTKLLKFTKKHKKRIMIASLLVFIGLVAFPYSRYFMLNTVGVRASASFKVVNAVSGRPVKNVDIEVSGKKGVTDNNGELKVQGLKLGSTKLIISKISYAKIEQKTTIGLGSNPYDTFKIDPVGVKYSFKILDWLSKRPLSEALISVDDSSAVSDKDGLAILSYEPGDNPTIKGTISVKGFKDEAFEFSSKNQDVFEKELIAKNKHYFISNRSGIYDIYSIQEDGKNEELILKGTGKENDNLAIYPNDEGTFLAYVSTRDGTLNPSSYVMSALFLIDTENKKIEKISESEDITFLGWDKNSLIFIKTKESYSGFTPSRKKIYSYNIKTKNFQELVSSDYFNDAKLIDGNLYYITNSQADGVNQSWFETIGVDGEGKKTILQKEAWGLIRNSLNTLYLSTSGNKWFSYKVGDSTAKEMDTPPNYPRSKNFINNISKTKYAWLDYRDGLGTIIVGDSKEAKEKSVYSKGGVDKIKSWLNDNHLVYRVSTKEESADYVLDVNSGEIKKVTNAYNPPERYMY